MERLKTPALMKDVCLGAQYVGGLRMQTAEKIAA